MIQKQYLIKHRGTEYYLVYDGLCYTLHNIDKAKRYPSKASAEHARSQFTTATNLYCIVEEYFIVI